MFEELWNFIKVHYESKRYHLLLGNIQLLIPLLNQSLLSSLPYVEGILNSLKEMFIHLDALAVEFHFRNYSHRYYIDPFYQQIKTFNNPLAESFLQPLMKRIPRSGVGKIRYAKYEHTFQKLHNANGVDPSEQLRIKRGECIGLLEAGLTHNQYAAWSDVILSYLDAQLQAGREVGPTQLAALLNFLDALLVRIFSVNGEEQLTEELWHNVFIALRLLSNSLAQASLGQELSCAVLSNWWQVHQSQAAGLFLLPVIAKYIAKHVEEDCTAWYELVKQINVQLSKQVGTSQTVLFADHRKKLRTMRSVFNELSSEFSSMTPQDLVKAQQQFTQDTLGLLNQFVQNIATLLGEAPCDFALCALGSTSREDRRPYSDIELVLLYLPKPNVNTAHLQTYLYYLVSGVELAIKQCGESHRENENPTLLQFAGFHLDDSSHLLKKGLIGTPEEIAQKFIFNLTQAWQAKGHPWLEDESFYSLLSPIVINADSHGSEQVLAEYKGLLQAYLNNTVAVEDNMELLINNLSLMRPPWFNSLKRREVIALSCLIDVARKSKVLLTSLVPGEIVDDIKRAFYKPLAYLALNLKLFYGLNAKHPAEIYAEAVAKLSWGQSQVLQLVQTALNYITHIQVKLHLQYEHQEERFIWLGVADENNAELCCLSTEEYAGLSLIKDSLLLPMCQWLETQLGKNSAFKLLDVLPFLLKSYLAKRNEPWLHRWTQPSSHSLSLIEILEHPLINILADYPSPNGWTPNYAQTMCRWMAQLQTLKVTSKTACLIEGIPTVQQQTSYLSKEIMDQLFDTKGEFKGNVHHSSQSKVSRISWHAPGQVNFTALYFKVKIGNEAGLMGREFAVINLHQLLGGSSHIALGWPLKLTYLTAQGSKIYYCWVSEEVPGSSLAEVMQTEHTFELINSRLDLQSYSHLFITHYLTCPEDGQPDNFKVEHTSNGTFRLYGLDVGQSFVGTHDEKRKVLSVKTMLYLLEPAIHQALDPQVLTQLMLLEPQALIKYWQANLKQMNQLFQPLFEAELAKTRVSKAQWYLHNQLVDLNEAVQMSVQKRLELLLNWLYSFPQQEKSGAILLKALEPTVALSYQSLRGKLKTPQDFYTIDPKAYVKNLNTGKMYSSTTYTSIQQQTLTPERLQRSLNLGEEYFATIDFRKLKDETEQRYVLALLQAAIQNKKRFTYLNLSGCTVLSEKALFELLQKLPELRELYLAACPQFNLSTVYTILSLKLNEKLAGFFRREYHVLCPQLRKLGVTLAGELHILDIPLTLAGRKQWVALTTQKQQQIESYRKRLLVMLEDKNFWVRASAAQSLVPLMVQLSLAQTEKTIEALLARLKDNDWSVRAATVQSLGQLAARLSPAQADKVTAALLAQLGDEDWHVRAAGAECLVPLAAQLSSAHTQGVIEALLARLGDGDEFVRKAAAQSLIPLAARLSPSHAKKVVAALLTQLKNIDWFVREAAAQSLGLLATRLSALQAQGVVEALLAQLEDDNRFVRAAMVESLGSLAAQISSAQAEKVVEALLVQLGDENYKYVRLAAAQSLDLLAAQLSTSQVQAVIEALLAELKDEDWRVRAAGTKCLGQLAAQLSTLQVQKVIEASLAQLEDENRYVRAAGVQCLGRHVARLSPSQAQGVIKALLIRLEDKNGQMRAATVRRLGRLATRLLSPQIQEVIEALLARLKDEDGQVRAATAVRLGRLTVQLSPLQAQGVIEALLVHLEDKDGKVRAAAARSLGRFAAWLSSLQVQELIEALLARLVNEDGQVRVAAAQCLGRLIARLSSVQAEKVAAALSAQLKDEDWRVRATETQCLGRLAAQLSPSQAQGVIKVLLARLEDEDWHVLEVAAQSLVPLMAQLSSPQAQGVVETLLGRLVDKDEHVRATARDWMHLMARFSSAQAEKVAAALLAQLEDENLHVRKSVAWHLGRLAAQLSPEQAQRVIEALLARQSDEALLARLGDEELFVQETVAQSLSLLATQLSSTQTQVVIETLLARLKDGNWSVQVVTIKSLAEFFSPASSLQWLLISLLQADKTAFEDLPNNNVQISQNTLFKLFSFLDPKTLLQVVPQVNKDWRRWQKVYLQQQAQIAREQNFIFLEEVPKEEVIDFYTRFQYSQLTDNANNQNDEALIDSGFKNAIQNSPDTTLKLSSKPPRLAQTNFFQHEENIQVTVPKQYTVQTNQQTIVFEVKAVMSDGDCGYTAFGITRSHAYQLLIYHLDKVRPLVKPALQEALRTQAFIDTLQRKRQLTQALSNTYDNYLKASHDGEMPQQVLDELDRAGEDLTILLAYIEYDVKAKQIDNGWSHPCILFALAEIQGIELHIWQCNEQEALVPHTHYPQHIPAQAATRTDLLFVNNNHFERLELIDNVQLSAQPSNTNSL